MSVRLKTEDGDIILSGKGKDGKGGIPVPQTAEVGQILKVKTIDSNGKPETWETSNLSSSEITTALGYTPINSTTKGAAYGVASLGSDGKVPSGQLPSMGGMTIETLKSNITISKSSTLIGNISSYKLILICNNYFSLMIPTSYLISSAANGENFHQYAIVVYGGSYPDYFNLYTYMNSNALSIGVDNSGGAYNGGSYVYGIS